MFRHDVRVRYAEVDLQGVVFNAHYLTWVDDAMSAWLEAVGFAGASWAAAGGAFDVADDEAGWDFMVRHAEIDWLGSAGFGDRVRIDAAVARWGTTSFDIAFEVCTDAAAVATVVLTYVGTRRDAEGRTAAAPVPARFRALLGEPPTRSGADAAR